MAPGVFEGILRIEHESKAFHHVKKGVETLKITFLAIFEKLWS